MQKNLRKVSRVKYLAAVAVSWGLGAGVSVVSMFATAAPAVSAADQRVSAPLAANTKIQLDRSGRTRVGKASFYAARYAGKTMADGSAMQLYSNNAASITLPLGTTAKVTNLETGKSAIVTIRDRGPYVAGRIVDLSPATARKIGLSRKQGLANVKVAPLTVPLVDGSVKVMYRSS